MILEGAIRPGDRLKEADLDGHLSNPNGDAAGDDAAGASETADEQDADYGLSEALNLLKGLAILRPGTA